MRIRNIIKNMIKTVTYRTLLWKRWECGKNIIFVPSMRLYISGRVFWQSGNITISRTKMNFLGYFFTLFTDFITKACPTLLHVLALPSCVRM